MAEAYRSRKDTDGRFVQPWGSPADSARGVSDMLRWQRERMRDGRPPSPPASAWTIEPHDVAQPRNTIGELRITWVGHATFLIQVDGVNILTDPIWSERASPIAWLGPRRSVRPGVPWDDLPPVDLVLLSHDHYDHLDSPTVHRLHERFGTGVSWVTPLGYRDWFARRGIEITELDWWTSTTVSRGHTALDVHATPAQHWTKRSPFTERTRLWSSFVIRTSHHTVFFCGDSGYFDGFTAISQALGPFSASLLPIGAYDPRWFMAPAHMNPEEAVQTWRDLGANGVFAGMHWGTFRLTDEDPLEPPRRTVAAWTAQGLAPDLLWLPRHGATRVVTAPAP